MDFAPYSKAIVSLILAIAIVLDQITGWSLPFLSEEWITSILAVLGPILVYFIPNRSS